MWRCGWCNPAYEICNGIPEDEWWLLWLQTAELALTPRPVAAENNQLLQNGSKTLWRINGFDISLSNEFYRHWLFLELKARLLWTRTVPEDMKDYWLFISIAQIFNLLAHCQWMAQCAGSDETRKQWGSCNPALCNVCVWWQQQKNICTDASHEETAQPLMQQHFSSF